MTEEGKRFVHVRSETLGGGLDERPDVCEQGFVQALTPAGKLYGTDLD
jgi:hypothetical protein